MRPHTMVSMPKTTFGQILRKHRDRLALTQQQLANLAKTGRVHLAQIESDTRKNVTLDLLRRLASVLGDEFGEEVRRRFLRGKRRK